MTNPTRTGRAAHFAINRSRVGESALRSEPEDYIVEMVKERGYVLKRFFDASEIPETVAFTPTETLYREYVGYHGRHAPSVRTPMTPQQFGVAFARACGYDGRRDPAYATRRVDGVKVRGWLGVTGPGSVIVSSKRGRRAKPKPPRNVA